MEKIDIIKLMIQEKQEQEKSQTNFEEEKHIKLLHNYYDEYCIGLTYDKMENLRPILVHVAPLEIEHLEM